MAERFVSPCPPPTPVEAEILQVLAEECNEVAVRVSKMLRFGVEEKQPGQELTNRERLSFEVGDLLGMVQEARDADLISEGIIETAADSKREKFEHFRQHRPDESGGNAYSDLLNVLEEAKSALNGVVALDADDEGKDGKSASCQTVIIKIEKVIARAKGEIVKDVIPINQDREREDG